MVLLAYYCLFILVASIVGGMIPSWVRLTHRRMEIAVSFVAGVMLGVALLHMLPHALASAAASPRVAGPVPGHLVGFELMVWLISGILVMFFIERFFCYHHHQVEEELEPGDEAHQARTQQPSCGHPQDEQFTHGHDITWAGAAWGLTLHSVLAGVALAASVAHGSHNSSWAGFGTFLVIFLHKPFDAMTIGMLMARSGSSPWWQSVVNGLFALAIPVGVVIFHFGLRPESTSEPPSLFLANALAFSAGMFLCISMSDLLPELQFHHHDRIKLSAALLLGLVVAYAAARFERAAHNHVQPGSSGQESGSASDVTQIPDSS